MNNRNNTKLCDLATKYKTDKGPVKTGLSPKSYTKHYSELFNNVKNEPLNLLEIGVKAGASLRMWKEYFPNAHIYGIDIQPKCKQHEEDRITIFIGDQKDRGFLKEVAQRIGVLHIVIDDGIHKSAFHIPSFEALFPHIASGGLYIIEDLHATLGLPCFTDELSEVGSTLDYFNNEIDKLMKDEPKNLGFIESISFYRPKTHGALMCVQKRQ